MEKTASVHCHLTWQCGSQPLDFQAEGASCRGPPSARLLSKVRVSGMVQGWVTRSAVPWLSQPGHTLGYVTRNESELNHVALPYEQGSY